MATAILGFSGKSISKILDKVDTVVEKMTGNPDYTNPNPSIITITGSANDLRQIHQDAMNGGTRNKKMQGIFAAILFRNMKSLLGYVQSASEGDAAKILGAGLDIKSSGSPVDILPAPVNFRGSFGLVSGEIILLWSGRAGRVEYIIQINETPGDNTKWVDLTSTGKTRYKISGLVSRKDYAFRIATKSPKGIGPWGDPTEHYAL